MWSIRWTSSIRRTSNKRLYIVHQTTVSAKVPTGGHLSASATQLSIDIVDSITVRSENEVDSLSLPAARGNYDARTKVACFKILFNYVYAKQQYQQKYQLEDIYPLALLSYRLTSLIPLLFGQKTKSILSVCWPLVAIRMRELKWLREAQLKEKYHNPTATTLA